MAFRVPASELRFRASRAGGPGGQHVNKAATRVEVTWDVAGSPSLSDAQRTQLLRRLGKRLDARGVLHVTSAASRSQWQNRQAAVERLHTVVADALKRRRPRKRTRPPRAAVERRLAEKRRRADTKRDRRHVDPET